MDIDGLPHFKTRVRTLLVAGLLACGLAIGALSLNAESSHASGPAAKASKVKILNETLYMEISQIKGNVIYAQGKSTGQFNATVTLHLTLQNASKAVAQIYANNSNGTITGNGAAAYHASGALSSFSGKEATLKGTGKYSHVRSLGIKMTGTMNRRTLKITINLKGKWNE
jgi:hypothetical protein